MGTNEIVASLGEPDQTEELDDGQFLWLYELPPFPADDMPRGTYVIGMSIGVTNGRLANWGFSYRDIPSERVESQKDKPLDTKDHGGSLRLKIFLVSSEPIPDGQFIDSERFPKLGFIRPNPSLTVRKLRDVRLRERTVSGANEQSRIAWAFGVTMTQEDAVRLKTFTATNVLKKILITIGDEPVVAPTIVMPLETGFFEITCDEKTQMEAISRQLNKIERK